MALRLSIISEQSTALGAAGTMIVDKAGARIGRAGDNEWVLPDPNRYISAHHARITFKNGTYMVEDTSTNGLYLNDELEPVGRLGPQPLRAGDTLRMGPYHIRVGDNDNPVVEAGTVVPCDASLAAGRANNLRRDIGVELSIDSLLAGDGDPSVHRSGYDPWDNPASDPGAGPIDSAPRALRSPHPPAARSEGPIPKAAAGPPSIIDAFCRGAGLSSQHLAGAGQERLLQLAGLLLRESLVGIKALARTQRELRQACGLGAIVEDPERVALQNLPVEELLVRLLLGHDRRQLDAVQWLRELYAFAARHEAALVRALRPALAEFTQRLDPGVLSQGSSGAEQFRSITAMADGRLPHLFAEALARSFNTQIGAATSED